MCPCPRAYAHAGPTQLPEAPRVHMPTCICTCRAHSASQGSVCAHAHVHMHISAPSTFSQDLFQLPAVEKYRRMPDQVYLSTLWPSFRFLELTESCRQGATERRFAELLSRLRRGRQALTEGDVALLQSRVCGSAAHGGVPHQECTPFDDVVATRRTGKRRRGAAAEGAAADALNVTTSVCHCPIKDDATVIAALRPKVNALNEQHVARLESDGTDVTRLPATDRYSSTGAPVTDEAVLSRLDAKASAQLRSLPLYTGMRALLTKNENVAGDFVNGMAGRVEGCDGSVVLFRPDGWAAERTPLRVHRRPMRYKVSGTSGLTRLQYPLLPACVPRPRLPVWPRLGRCITSAFTSNLASTSHRPQHIPHILTAPPGLGTHAPPIASKERLSKAMCTSCSSPLAIHLAYPAHNPVVQHPSSEWLVSLARSAEFFAPGMAYVALSRARRLDQIHLWGLDLNAIHADARIAGVYARLAQRPLTDVWVQHAPLQQRAAVAPIAATHATSFKAH